MEELMRPNQNDWGISQLQNCILNITKYIDSFCCDNKISYCLMGGSALGAVRHKGFIPWDDDMDIFMRPDDYNRFRELFLKNGDKKNFYLQEWGSDDGKVTLAKLRYNKSAYIEEDIKDWQINHGVFVDIFILHTCPDNKIKRLNQYMWAKYLVAKGATNRNNKKKGLLGIALKMLSWMPKRFLLKHALNEVYKYQNEPSTYLCHFLGHANLKAGLYNRQYFKGTKRFPFESIMLNVPYNVEEYLHDRWGDYMQLPPIDEISHYQHCWKWDVDNPFKDYNDKGEYPDEKFLLT